MVSPPRPNKTRICTDFKRIVLRLRGSDGRYTMDLWKISGIIIYGKWWKIWYIYGKNGIYILVNTQWYKHGIDGMYGNLWYMFKWKKQPLCIVFMVSMVYSARYPVLSTIAICHLPKLSSSSPYQHLSVTIVPYDPNIHQNHPPFSISAIWLPRSPSVHIPFHPTRLSTNSVPL